MANTTHVTRNLLEDAMLESIANPSFFLCIVTSIAPLPSWPSPSPKPNLQMPTFKNNPKDPIETKLESNQVTTDFEINPKNRILSKFINKLK
jgi:hypothetical protein